MKCPACGRENRNDATNCFACKTSLMGDYDGSELDSIYIYERQPEQTEIKDEPLPYQDPEATPLYQVEQEDEDAQPEEDETYSYTVPDVEDDDDTPSPDDEERVPIYESGLPELEPVETDVQEEQQPGSQSTPIPEPEPTSLEHEELEADIQRAQQMAEQQAPPPPPTDTAQFQDPPTASETPPPPDPDELDELVFDDDTDGQDDDDDFVLSSTEIKRSKSSFVLDDDDGLENDEKEIEFFEDTDEDDFDISPSKELDAEQASQVELIRTLLSKMNRLRHAGKDITDIETKVATVLNCKDPEQKSFMAKECLENIENLDKEADNYIFEETAGTFHAIRARMLTMAKQGKQVDAFALMLDDASQALSMCDFSRAETILKKIETGLDSV